MPTPRFTVDVVVARDAGDVARAKKMKPTPDVRVGRVLTLDDVDAARESVRVRYDAVLARCRVSARIARTPAGADAATVVERACGARNIVRYAPVGDGARWVCDVEPDAGETWATCAANVGEAARTIARGADEGRVAREYDADVDNGF